jgi:5-methylcytosine-specific restriction endonuclease McrA
LNRWNIPSDLEAEIRQRDRRCIYCGGEFFGTDVSRKSRPSWEHIINDASLVSRENIALCCISCNASKGAKTLAAWLESSYCRKKSISVGTIADVARKSLR